MSAYRDFVGQAKVDVLVSNPPYIAHQDPNVEENVRKFEPNTALYAEDNGLALLKGWSAEYAAEMANPGIMLMEMGMSQGSAMAKHFSDLKIFNEINVIKDLSGHDRVIRGVTHG